MTTQTSDSAGRLVPLDILRAIAIVLVIGRHLDPPPAGATGSLIGTFWRTGGWVGVDLFFVLSGFLVSGLLFREHRKHKTLDVTRFYVRRGFKIYPAFFVLIACTVLLRCIRSNGVGLRNVLAEVLFCQNYFTGLWGHTWSLAVEEHFYLIIPVILVLLARRRRDDADPFSIVPWIFVAVAVIALVLRLVNASRPYEHRTHSFPSHLRIDSMLFGVLISYWYHYRSEPLTAICRKYALALAVAGAALLAPAFLFALERTPFIYTFGFTCFYLGAGMILCAALIGGPNFGTIGKWVAYVGTYSYSIYLWHLMVLERVVPRLQMHSGTRWPWALDAFVGVIMSVGIGIVAGKAIEYPVLRLRERWFPSRAQVLEPAAGRPAVVAAPPSQPSGTIATEAVCA